MRSRVVILSSSVIALAWPLLVFSQPNPVPSSKTAGVKTAGNLGGSPAEDLLQQDRKVFSKSVVPLPPQGGFHVNALKPADKEHTLELHFALEMRNSDELAARVAAGELVSADEMSTKYSPIEADYTKLVNWLRENGFQIVNTSSDRTSVYARATIGQIEQSLKVKMARVTVGGVTYDAAASAPSLPTNVGAHVLGINGLQPFVRAHKNSIKIPMSYLSNRSSVVRTSDILDIRSAQGSPAEAVPPHGSVPQGSPKSEVSPALSNHPPYLVGEILKAYNGANIGLTGNGEKIAILIDTVPSEADLVGFWKYNKLSISPSQIQTINVNQVQLPSLDGEETLDAEWTSGVAPGATIRIYASGSLEFVDLDKALDRLIADLQSEPAIHQLSISLGLGESYMPTDEVVIERQKFLTLASRGVNVFVSSGDAGSNPDQSGHNTIPGPQQVEYESSDPFTVGVGGTTLELDSLSGLVKDEGGWTASGGGVSMLFDRPKWQRAPGMQSGTKRLVPDVSLVADPSTGAMYFFQGRIEQIGGTSWSAPVWAGICALANEARAKAGKKPLSFLPPHIYPLAGSNAFRDIQKGSNGAYSAQQGYDMVTGIGVPNIKALVAALERE